MEGSSNGDGRFSHEGISWFVNAGFLPADPTAEQRAIFLQHLKRCCPKALADPSRYAAFEFDLEGACRVLGLDRDAVCELGERRRIRMINRPQKRVFAAADVWRLFWERRTAAAEPPVTKRVFRRRTDAAAQSDWVAARRWVVEQRQARLAEGAGTLSRASERRRLVTLLEAAQLFQGRLLPEDVERVAREKKLSRVFRNGVYYYRLQEMRKLKQSLVRNGE